MLWGAVGLVLLIAVRQRSEFVIGARLRASA